MKFNSRTLWGLVFIVLGVVWILGIVGVFSFDLFFRGWWTLIIILAGVVSLFSSKADRKGSVFLICLGVLLLLAEQGAIDWNMFWKLGVAVLVILTGVGLISGRRNCSVSRSSTSNVTLDGKDVPCLSVAFGEQKLSFDGKVFEGARVSVCFGAARVDLRNAVIPDNAVIEIDCSFAGTEILVPQDVKILSDLTTCFGGLADKRPVVYSGSAPTIHVRGKCSFGGIEIR